MMFAHMWWNVSASTGDENAVESRKEIARTLTRPQLEKAKDFARECVRKKYKGCLVLGVFSSLN